MNCLKLEEMARNRPDCAISARNPVVFEPIFSYYSEKRCFPDSAPICPRALCCNKILKAEVRQLSVCYPLSATLCHQIYDLVTEENSPSPAVNKKEEIIVDCSIYGKETTVKRIVIPRASLISDMLSAVLQLQKLAKNRTTSSLGIYIRHDGKRYEQLRPKLLGKKPVKEMSWPDSMAVVIDVDGCLSKKRA